MFPKTSYFDQQQQLMDQHRKAMHRPALPGVTVPHTGSLASRLASWANDIDDCLTALSEAHLGKSLDRMSYDEAVQRLDEIVHEMDEHVALITP